MQPITPETVTSYEAGFKGDLLDQRLRVNADVFYMDYNRILSENATQCTPASSDDPGTPLLGGTGLTCPAGTPLAGQTGLNWFYYQTVPGHDKGVELEMTADPIENLTLSYSLGYNTFSSGFVPNNQYLIQPEYTMSGSIQYAIPLSSGMGQVIPRLDWSYRSHGSNAGTSGVSTAGQYHPRLQPLQCPPHLHQR